MTTGTRNLVTHAHTFRSPLSVSPGVEGGPIESAVTRRGLYFIPREHSWDEAWVLLNDLVVSIQSSQNEVVAVTFLTHTVQEYGIGSSLDSAISDLLTSLSDYYEFLEDRQDRLATEAVGDLEGLRSLIRRKPSE